MRTLTLAIDGYLVGPIWWPSGTECWKYLDYSCTDQQARTVGRMTLRDHLLRATLDGDFQHATIAAGTLRATITTVDGTRRTSRSRSWPLGRFPSIAGMVHPDPDWCPVYEGEDA